MRIGVARPRRYDPPPGFMVTGFEMIMPLIIGHYVDDLGFLATKVALALAVRKFSQQGLDYEIGRASCRERV